MSNEELRRILDRYFSQKIQLRQQRKRAALAAWQPAVDAILQYVTSRDPRFKLKLFYSGSYYERTKVKEPNEFDIMLEMENLKLGTWEPYDDDDNLASDPPPGFTTVMIDQGEEDQWIKRDRCIGNGNLLSSTAIKSTFARLVNEAVRDLNLSGVSASASGPAVKLSIDCRDFRGSIDLTLAIQDATWPEDAEDWKRNHPRNGWPSQELVNDIVKGGCHLVAKKPKTHTNQQDVDFFWRYSFSRAEKELFTKSSSGAAGTCRRNLLRILKCLREDLQLTPLTTYHLKTIVLYEYEAFPRDTDWGTNQMPVRFNSALTRLLTCLRQKRCRHYFISEVNLFDSGSFNDQRYQFLRDRVEQLISNPCGIINALL